MNVRIVETHASPMHTPDTTSPTRRRLVRVGGPRSTAGSGHDRSRGNDIGANPIGAPTLAPPYTATAQLCAQWAYRGRMKGFVYRLIAPRPTFSTDMSPDEHATLMDHAAYWSGLLAEGKAIAYGPVGDPRGSYGLGILLVEDLAAAEAIRDADPAITAPHRLRAELAPMIRLVTVDGVFDGG